jgi:two-component system, NtrC family, sensor histidine kinase PilS
MGVDKLATTMNDPSATPERRQGDRRRHPREPLPELDESWFGAVGVGPDSEQSEVYPFDAGDSRQARDWRGAQEAQADSRFLSRQARRLITAGANAFERIYRTFLGARAALGLALVIALAASGYFVGRPSLEVTAISVAYAVAAVLAWLWPSWRARPSLSSPGQLANSDARAGPDNNSAQLHKLSRRQWVATIGVDIACFSGLHLLSFSGTFNYVAMLVLPVLMAGVLTPRLTALATAACVTLSLLAVAWLSAASGVGAPTSLMAQAGLTGIGLFVIAVLAGELAGRLAREELTAKGSLELARQQAQLNRLMIEEMQDGVLVVDKKGRVRAANPAARRLLAPQGMCHSAPFRMRGVPEWDRLVSTVDQALLDGYSPEEGSDVTLNFDGGVRRTVRVRIRFTRRNSTAANEALCVLLLEDVRSMQARSRQEKLAAMGRVSAGIAHEIRNPLAAISQANALLSEDATTASQRQLTHMVNENVDRLKRIVDDVMEVAAGGPVQASVIDMGAVLLAACQEWAHAQGLTWFFVSGDAATGEHNAAGAESLLYLTLPQASHHVAFDTEHLRRVLVNLLDNAKRHASGGPGCVQVILNEHGMSGMQLLVCSDGEVIPQDVEQHLFEPFFSTRSRGTGLGLYICRELCERYGASIDYRRRTTEAGTFNEFFVRMPKKNPAVSPSLQMRQAVAPGRA